MDSFRFRHWKSGCKFTIEQFLRKGPGVELDLRVKLNQFGIIGRKIVTGCHQFGRNMEIWNSDLLRHQDESYIEISVNVSGSHDAVVRHSDLHRPHRATKRTVTNSYGMIPPAKELTALRRTGRSFVLRVLVPCFFVFFGTTKSVDAQHCGRVAETAIWMGSQLSWEREDSQPGFDSGRIRTAGCEGPMCRSRTPVPFSEPTSLSGAIFPLPWNCTSLKFVPLTVALSGRISPFVVMSISDPFSEPLFEPPRFV